jgi:predicted DNA repair protein MutK
MPSGFFCHLMTSAVLMDDVAAMSKITTKKQGILADDLAVNAKLQDLFCQRITHFMERKVRRLKVN